ncbi:MAG: hypothetical protein Ct9H90mP20_4000 [Candidatus Neomarinimicrobiota bacterium]|nr:MAG: hypothetical protein Ct9H90mP20_4000 [Candidatus Neomarinimicrobiota bacterium]
MTVQIAGRPQISGGFHNNKDKAHGWILTKMEIHSAHT